MRANNLEPEHAKRILAVITVTFMTTMIKMAANCICPSGSLDAGALYDYHMRLAGLETETQTN
jgi:hypothetical protein